MDKVTHFHIPADDVDRAEKFYEDIFGWEIQDIGMEHEYRLATTVEVDEKGMPKEPGAINGAIYKREKPEEYLTVVINVDSINDSTKKVKATGGKIVSPKREGELGILCRVPGYRGQSDWFLGRSEAVISDIKNKLWGMQMTE